MVLLASYPRPSTHWKPGYERTAGHTADNYMEGYRKIPYTLTGSQLNLCVWANTVFQAVCVGFGTVIPTSLYIFWNTCLCSLLLYHSTLKDCCSPKLLSGVSKQTSHHNSLLLHVRSKEQGVGVDSLLKFQTWRTPSLYVCNHQTHTGSIKVLWCISCDPSIMKATVITVATFDVGRLN